MSPAPPRSRLSRGRSAGLSDPSGDRTATWQVYRHPPHLTAHTHSFVCHAYFVFHSFHHSVSLFTLLSFTSSPATLFEASWKAQRAHGEWLVADYQPT